MTVAATLGLYVEKIKSVDWFHYKNVSKWQNKRKNGFKWRMQS